MPIQDLPQRFAILAIALVLPLAATANEGDTIESAGSSGKHYPEQPAACAAAQKHASDSAIERCTRDGGTAGEAVPTTCECEQGGFEGKEWLCTAKATLTCEAGGEAPPPGPATGSADRLGFQLPETLTNLQLLEVDFVRRGRTVPRASIADRYAEACKTGWMLACEAGTWHEDGASSLTRAEPALGKACDAGDTAACIALGWVFEGQARGSTAVDSYKAAARRYKSACDDDGDQWACYEYGVILFNDLGVSDDPRFGTRRWESACKAGEAAACTALARAYVDGSPPQVKADRTKAATFAKKACDMGDPFGCVEAARGDEGLLPGALQTLCRQGGVDACWELASSYRDGKRQEPAKGRTRDLLDLGCELGHGPSCSAAATAALSDGDESVAARLFRRACEVGGDVNACTSLVDMIIAERTSGSVRQDKYAYEVACSKGENPMACSELGLALLDGEGINKDKARARALLQQSCVDKTSAARPCFVLGELYETGAGGERDRTLAATYYKWACAQGWGEACDRRGDLLDQGVGVREDDNEAVATYQLGCDAGLPKSCHKAAVILDEGTNITRDPKRAMSLYETACDKGVGEACLRLGKLYVEGVVGGTDDSSAREAFEKAVALKNVEAHRRLARLLWNGLGGKKDKKRAKALCATGCQADDPIACRGPDWQTAGSR